MSSNAVVADAQVGQALLAIGCQQGALLDAPALMHFLRRAAPTEPWTVSEDRLDDAKLIVAAQNCDIHASSKAEPYVEALTARWSNNPQEIHTARKGNSARLYLLKEGEGRALLADARRRHHLEKRALLACNFEQVLDERGRGRFASWIAARYNRPAIANAVVDALQKPLVKALDARAQREREALGFDRIAELRFLVSEAAPFSITLIAMLDEGEEFTPEQEAELGGWLEDNLVADNDAVAEIRLVFRSPTSISLNDYLQTTRLQLDQFSTEVEPEAAA